MDRRKDQLGEGALSEEKSSDSGSAEGSGGDTQTTDQASSGTVVPKWEHKTGFRIVGELRAVLTAAKDAAEKERDILRRKLDKITYGG
jgi:hypothetical protein